jgi:hypothetical protein
MKIFKISILLILFVLILLHLTACSSDDQMDDPVFSKTEADAAMQANAPALIAIAKLVGFQAKTAATTGNVTHLEINEEEYYTRLSAFRKRHIGGLKKMLKISPMNGDDSFNYDGSGCWSIDYDTTDLAENLNVSILAQVCFDVWNDLGGPTGGTNEMLYTMGLDLSDIFTEGDQNFSIDLEIIRNIKVTGIADYKLGIGNRLVVSGINEENLNLSVTTLSGSQSIALNYSFTINNVEMTGRTYPVFGIIDFSIGYSSDPQIQDYPDFSITGKIGFDFQGQEIVGVTFAGYKYSLNLITGQIS